MKSLPVILFGLLLIAGSAWAADTLQITLTWQNTNTSSRIQVQKATSPFGPFNTLTELDQNTTSYVDATNEAGKRSCYRLAYINAAGAGTYTAAKCKTLPTLPPPPPASVGLK